MAKQPEIVVVGAGHAGLEAVFCAAKMGCAATLVVLKKDYVANCPCNPSIGGPAKGIVTREIDALGGMQAMAADACQLQMKLLNASKGPGVQALRAQIDKVAYRDWFAAMLKKAKNVKVIEAEATAVAVKHQTAVGVILSDGSTVRADAVILTTGTYMESVTHRGKDQKAEGPSGYLRSETLSKNLRDLGFETIRLKTGTPPRIKKGTIDYAAMAIEPGSPGKHAFSARTKRFVSLDEQLPCYLLHTNEQTHAIIKKHFRESAMFSGQITGVGPRYCPSIEDKIFRFADKPRHQLFLEPESLRLDTMYLGGFSTSFPEAIQDRLIRTLPGLEKCEVARYGYAIEYDAIDPLQLFPTLETKRIANLYTAGQINGSSGYEEAAGQGLVAGINAALKLRGEPPLVLRRDEAYIGVMVDDLVTKGVTEPYRLLTSRAEHRLLLRHDNAHRRLIGHARRIGTVDAKTYRDHLESEARTKTAADFLKARKVGSYPALKQKTKNTNFTLFQYLKRPEVKLADLLAETGETRLGLTDGETNALEIQIKYEGYISNHLKALKGADRLNEVKIPADLDYANVLNLSNEAIDKLTKIRPLDLAQANRISGINFPDIVAIKTHLEKARAHGR